MRFISFTVPGSPDLLVRMKEQVDGSIVFNVDVNGAERADLRGLFFDVRDPDLLPHLSITGAQVTRTMFRDEGVIDLGNGNNMRGDGRQPFDVGVAFGTEGIGKDDIASASFVLRSAVGGLTLDDLALTDFGVRMTSIGPAGSARSGSAKTTVVAPAAPDALDDSATALEDVPTTFALLANDRDEDNLADLRIVSVTDPEHGTVAIAPDGKSVIYTSNGNYSGPDSFEYSIVDGKGGGDTAKATVAVVAVADAPKLSVTTAAGAKVNEILVTVSAEVSDMDGSEHIDRFEFSGLPSDVALSGTTPSGVFDPTAEAGKLTQTFTLTLPLGKSSDFDLGVTAVAKERSNGDEEIRSLSKDVTLSAASTTVNAAFLAQNQSIWDSGAEYSFTKDYFLGLDTSFDESGGDFVEYDIEGSLKAGFNTRVGFEGGDIDATVPYDVTVDTNYNRTTDVLMISSSSLLKAASFVTTGPEGSFGMDFVFNFGIDAKVELDFGDLGKPDVFDFDEGSSYSRNLFTLRNEDLPAGVPIWPGYLTLGLDWPDLVTTSAGSGGMFSSSGVVNDFLKLTADADHFLTLLLGTNPLGVEFNAGVAGGEASLIDLDLIAFADFRQAFTMNVEKLVGVITFEDGSSRPFNFGEDIIITNASALDLDGDGVEFTLSLAPKATLRNDTDLLFDLGIEFQALYVDGWYDFGIYADRFTVGPVFELFQSYPVGSANVYDKTFDLAFETQHLQFVA